MYAFVYQLIFLNHILLYLHVGLLNALNDVHVAYDVGYRGFFGIYKAHEQCTQYTYMYSKLCLSRICWDWRSSFDLEKIWLMMGYNINNRI